MSTSGKTVNRYVGCTLCVVTARFSLPNSIGFFHVNHENLNTTSRQYTFVNDFLYYYLASVVGKV